MNWGNGIAIFLTVFVLSMLGLVYLTTRSAVDLEAEDYYAQEILYQDRIDALSAGTKYVNQLIVESQETTIQVRVIGELAEAFEDGRVFFYRPNDAKLDRKFELDVIEGVKNFPKDEFVRGKYEVRVEWKVNGIFHVLVKDLIVN